MFELPQTTSSRLGVVLPHGLGRLGRQPSVFGGRLVPGLPGAVHLIAQAPHPHVVRLGDAIGDTAIRECRPAGVVRVLEQIDRFPDPPGAQVDGHHGLDLRLAGPPHELVESELVGLGGVPGQVQPPRTLIRRPHPVLPAVAGDEVAAGIPDGRHAELSDQFQHVLAKPIVIGGRVARLVDAGVDTPPHVFDE